MLILTILYVVSVVIAWVVFYFIASLERLVGLSDLRARDYVKVTIAAIFWPLVGIYSGFMKLFGR